MKYQAIFLLLFLMMSFEGFAVSLSMSDSVGLSEKEGRKYIIHQVEAGETLYALSRKYDVDVKSIKDANDASVNRLSVGQKVLIPLKENASLQGNIHIVRISETLYSISRMYNVTVDELREWNNLSENNVDIGQELIVGQEGETTNDPSSVNKLSIGQNALIPLKETKGFEEKIHIVRSSETLYSISRMYSVTVDELREWNNLNESNIVIGQELIVRQEGVDANNEVEEITVITGKTHTVERSETLFSISRKYNVTTDQLKQWNSLSSNALSIGQVLVVSAGAGAVEEVEPRTNSSMLPSASEQVDEEVVQKTEVPAKVPEVAVAVNVIPAIPEERPDDDLDDEVIERPADKVIEKGLAEVIESTSDTKKYLALHRQAPIGTIMQVKNEMNGQSVFVRIVGSIQDTGDNTKVLLMISKKAYDRLGAIDRRFPVQISYIP